MGTLPLLSLPGCLSVLALRAQTSYKLFCKPLACKPLQLLAHNRPSLEEFLAGGISLFLLAFLYTYIALQMLIVFYPGDYKS